MRSRHGWIGFTLALVVVNGGGAALVTLIAKDPLVTRAVWASAAAAAGVQLLGFGFARLLIGRKHGLFVGWGAAMAVRFTALVVYALLVFKVIPLVPAPALVSFAVLLLLTSIVEPLFLNA